MSLQSIKRVCPPKLAEAPAEWTAAIKSTSKIKSMKLRWCRRSRNPQQAIRTGWPPSFFAYDPPQGYCGPGWRFGDDRFQSRPPRG